MADGSETGTGRDPAVGSTVAIVLALLALGCAAAVFYVRDATRAMECHAPPTPSTVATDPAPVRQHLPVLGDVTQVHYQWIDAGVSECPGGYGPSEYRLVGFAVPSPGQADRLRQRYGFTPDPGPAVPGELIPFAPPAPSWTRSDELDRAGGGRFWLDTGGGTVFHDFTTS